MSLIGLNRSALPIIDVARLTWWVWTWESQHGKRKSGARGESDHIPKATEMWSCQNTYFNANKVSKEYAYKSVWMGRCLEQIPGFRRSGNLGDKWCETKVLSLFLFHLEGALLSPRNVFETRVLRVVCVFQPWYKVQSLFEGSFNETTWFDNEKRETISFFIHMLHRWYNSEKGLFGLLI